ncbi:alpha/beta fold hydrolase [Planctomycetota bacterium]|nr:alpha/beta fold hydrolase [Planctomycetota bacterium]
MMKLQKKKWLWIIVLILSIVVVLGVCGALYFSWLMKQPLYTVGDVSAEKNLRSPLQPPDQVGITIANEWLVEQDVKLAFDQYGSGEPVLVIHGGPGIPYPKLWKGLENLTDQHKFYLYDQRGAGRSTRLFDRFEDNFYNNMIQLEQAYGLGAQVADIERIRRILGKENLNIIGHSYGGFIATLYAAEFPDRVNRLILVAPADVLVPFEEKNEDLFTFTQERLNTQNKDKFKLLMREYFDFQNIFTKSDQQLANLHVETGKYLLRGMDYDPSIMDNMPASGGWSVFAVYFSSGQSGDFRPALKKVKAKTLIVHGRDDLMALRGSQSYQGIKDSQFVFIEREKDEGIAGHFVYDDNPTAFEAVVGKFLDDPN